MSESTSGVRPRRARTRRLTALVSTLAIATGSLLLAPAAFAAPAAAITIDVTPTAATEGETVEVVVTATSVSDLYAYDLRFEYDPALLELVEGSGSGPDGGYTSAVVESDSIIVSHARLGTSPGLSTTGTDAIVLAAFSFTVLDGGSATIALDTARLVGSDNSVVALADVDSATVTLTALPDPEPEPEPEPEPSESATSTPSPTPSASATAAASAPLAATGADATPWLIGGAAAIALIAAGALIVIRRRQAVSE